MTHICIPVGRTPPRLRSANPLHQYAIQTNRVNDVCASSSSPVTSPTTATRKNNNVKNIQNMKILVLDLDETLVHSSQMKLEDDDNELNFMILNTAAISSANNVTNFSASVPVGVMLYVYERPGAAKFVEKMNQLFNVFIFTAGERNYATQVINRFFPFIQEENRLFRDSCKVRVGKVYKDLYMFRKPMDEVLIIDDCQDMQTFFPRNTVLIKPFYGDPDDSELEDTIEPMMEKCAVSTDVRNVIPQAVSAE